jgi:hypothetical protein
MKVVHAAAGETCSQSSGEDESYILCDYDGMKYDDPQSSFDWKKVTCKDCLASMKVPNG